MKQASKAARVKKAKPGAGVRGTWWLPDRALVKKAQAFGVGLDLNNPRTQYIAAVEPDMGRALFITAGGYMRARGPRVVVARVFRLEVLEEAKRVRGIHEIDDAHVPDANWAWGGIVEVGMFNEPLVMECGGEELRVEVESFDRGDKPPRATVTLRRL